MKITRSTPDSAPARDATHILHWLPPYLTHGPGHWELHDLPDYEAGEVGTGDALHAPRDADADTLAAWAAGQLGYRVDLELAWARFTPVAPGGPFRRGREPVWYARAARYTSPEVLQAHAGGADWADPDDPETIDWGARQAAAAIWFDVAGGRPVSPFGPAFVRRGRNELGRWGENRAADAVVTADYAGFRWLLMVERGDGYGWAVPGGMAEPGESGPQAAVRELIEETALPRPLPAGRALPARHVPDPRESGEAWVVTIPVLIDLGMVGALPAVAGGDDVARAEWVIARDYATLEQSLQLDHARGRVFAAHAEMLRELIDGPAYAACEQLLARHPAAVRDLRGDRQMTIADDSNGDLYDLVKYDTAWGCFYRLYAEGADQSVAKISPGDVVVTDPGRFPGGITPMLLGAAPAEDLALAR